MTEKHKYLNNLILLSFVLLKFVLQYVIVHPAFDLQRDEYLHIDLGYHLAWGYISVPPFTSWISAVIILLGKSVFWVRFFPALFGALTIIVAWKIVKSLGGNLFAQVTCAIALLLSTLLRLNMLFQPNTFDVFWWTLVFYCSINLVKEGKPKWYYFLALSLAFGFLSKYNIVFLFLGLFPSLVLFTKAAILKNKHFYLAFLLSLIIISPNLLWQYSKGFPTYYQLQELQETQLKHVEISSFFKEQILYFINSILIVLLGFVAFIASKSLRKYGFIFMTYIIVLCLFLYLHAKAYYAFGLYPVIIATGAFYFEKLTQRKSVKLWLRPLMLVLIIAGAVPLFLIAFPFKSPEAIAQNSSLYKKFGLLIWEDGKEHNMPQDFADMLGWKSLAREVDSAYSLIPNKEETMVFSDNYGQAGAINYHSSFPKIKAVSFNADYIYWIDTSKPIRNLIMVKDNAEDANGFLAEAGPAFDTAYIFSVNKNELSREVGRTILVCIGAKEIFKKFFIKKRETYLEHKKGN